MVGIGAKASLDFVRLLRVAILHERTGLPFREFFDVGDPRTLRRLLTRAGVSPDVEAFTVVELLNDQSCVRNEVAIENVQRLLRGLPSA
jgi:hypothetical protein